MIYERAKFNQRCQEPGESVDSFITALYVLAEYCGYAGLHDEMIRDRIVVGLRDARLSEKLQLDADLTLEKIFTQVRQAEALKQQQSLVRGASVNHKQPDTHVGAVRKRRPTKPKQQRSDKSEQTPKTTCGWCGLMRSSSVQPRMLFVTSAANVATSRKAVGLPKWGNCI